MKEWNSYLLKLCTELSRCNVRYRSVAFAFSTLWAIVCTTMIQSYTSLISCQTRIVKHHNPNCVLLSRVVRQDGTPRSAPFASHKGYKRAKQSRACLLTTLQAYASGLTSAPMVVVLETDSPADNEVRTMAASYNPPFAYHWVSTS